MWQLIKKLLNDVKQNGIEGVFGRYYGTYLCTVVKNDDPSKRGRIRVRGSVFPGSSAKGFTGLWIPPKSFYVGNGYGAFFPPEEGSNVYVCFLDGDKTRPFYDGGGWATVKKEISDYYPFGEGTSPFKDIQTKQPSIRGIITETGYKIIFAEDNSNHRSPNKKPYFEIETPKGQHLKFDDEDGKESLEILDKENNRFYSDSKGIIIEDKFGNKYISTENGIEMISSSDAVIKIANNGNIEISGDMSLSVQGNVDLIVDGDTHLKSPNVKIEGGEVAIGNVDSPIQGFCSLQACVFSGVVHTTNTHPSV